MALMLATEVFAPSVRVITFSLWRSPEDAMAFAYPQGGGEHGEAIGRAERHDWASEMLFARFRPVSSQGTWCGTDPLVPASASNVKAVEAMAHSSERTPTVTKDQAVAVAESSLRELVSMLDSVTRRDARAIGEWTVHDVAAHLAAALAVYPSILRGEGSPVAHVDSIAAWNAEAVRNAADRDYDALCQEIRQGVADVCDAMRSADDDSVVWHGGLRLPLATVSCVLAGEALIHGRDIARAVGHPWPIGADRARTVLVGLVPLMPHYVDAERAARVRACYDVRLRGGDRPRIFLVFDSGKLSVESPSSRAVACRIWADPVAFLLVAYGRTGPWSPALRGRILAAGRKPWLAFLLPQLLRKP
jgi:uncharacterized protein (TIGR03083 family)